MAMGTMFQYLIAIYNFMIYIRKMILEVGKEIEMNVNQFILMK